MYLIKTIKGDITKISDSRKKRLFQMCIRIEKEGVNSASE